MEQVINILILGNVSKYMRKYLVLFILFLACDKSEVDHHFFNVDATNYSDALKEGFERASVDVELIEKKENGVIIGLHYTNDQETLLTKSWRFNKRIEKSFIDSVATNNDMNYVTPLCNVDSVRTDFCLLDKRNRIFVGRSFKEEQGENYTEIVYFFPR